MSAAPHAAERAALAETRPAARTRARAWLLAGCVLGAGLVAAQGLQAWTALRAERADLTAGAVQVGGLCSVMLVNGQIYYGELAAASARSVTLQNVYYVQAVQAAPGGAPANRLVSRRRTDWHAPTKMAIPAEKILMIEAVGADSRLAELIKQDSAAPARP